MNNNEQTLYDEHGNPVTVVKKSDTASEKDQPQIVYMARPHTPVKPVIPEESRQKHEESNRLYPHLNLSEGEYVISAIRRHPIGLLSIWAVVIVAIAILSVAIFYVMGTGAATSGFITAQNSSSLGLVLLLLIVLVFLGGVIATVVYEANRFFLTNESVTQQIQISLFAKKEQTISLVNIEDASFRQHGIIQTIFNFGSLRLSTEGDETTYRFSFVADPARQVALLNDAVEAFKNGRPIDPNEDQD